MKNIHKYLLLLSLAYCSCDPGFDHIPPKEIEGLVPIYSKDPAIKHITAEGPRTTLKGGKMYTTGKLLFQVEPDSGIHIINYADPVHPQKLGFIRSMLCKEISVKNGFIYTNNFNDLVVIDITNINNVREISRVDGVFPDLALQYPTKDPNDFSQLYFECPDPEKGVIIGWKKQKLSNPKCWR